MFLNYMCLLGEPTYFFACDCSAAISNPREERSYNSPLRVDLCYTAPICSEIILNELWVSYNKIFRLFRLIRSGSPTDVLA